MHAFPHLLPLFCTPIHYTASPKGSSRTTPNDRLYRQRTPLRERKGEKGPLALQFFHQNFLFNLPACCSNCEAPCCRASAVPRGTVCQWRRDRCGPLPPMQPRRPPSKLRPGGASQATTFTYQCAKATAKDCAAWNALGKERSLNT